MSLVVPLLNTIRTITALEMIRRALRLLGVYSSAEVLSAEEAADGLSALNSMIDSWSNESLLMYSHSLDVVSLTTGLAQYTLGATGTVVTNRPTQVLPASYINYNGVSTPIAPLTLEQYTSIAYKSLTGSVPSVMLFEADYPNATLTLYPAPVAGCTLNLWSIKPLSGFASVGTTVSLPPGYEDAIVFNLAVMLAPEFEAQPSPLVLKTAAVSKKAIKRTNTAVPVLGMPAGVYL